MTQQRSDNAIIHKYLSDKKKINSYKNIREEFNNMWSRDLPFDEMIFDRWERANHLGFGEGTSVYHNSYIYGNVQVGKNTWIGPYTILDGTGGLVIGDYCSISAGVYIYTHDSVKWAVSGGKIEYERAPVSIGDCSYIGSKTIIDKGTSIGDHSIIGASSFVNHDIPPYSIAFGTPCRVVGQVIIGMDGTIRLDYFNKK